ncbi:MAG TPA: translesion error-prone DNA polymerase V autoproteolytic subunit [Pseudomonadales bacterium]
MKLTQALPFYEAYVAAGFPSPADDYVAHSLDLHTYLVKHPAATYFARASGDSMQGEGIFSGDILIIDRALEPQHGHIVIAAMLGEFTCKKLDKHNKKLLAANPDYPSLAINEDTRIEGVVTYSIRQHVRTG